MILTADDMPVADITLNLPTGTGSSGGCMCGGMHSQPQSQRPPQGDPPHLSDGVCITCAPAERTCPECRHCGMGRRGELRGIMLCYASDRDGEVIGALNGCGRYETFRIAEAIACPGDVRYGISHPVAEVRA